MIDFATQKDHPEIIPVWQSGFDDNADDVAEFLAGTDGFCDRLVFREGEKIFAEMNIIRCELSAEGRRVSAVYFYALATLPEYRGRGIMSSMIRFALDKYAADGISYAMIVPAEEGEEFVRIDGSKMRGRPVEGDEIGEPVYRIHGKSCGVKL